jgi:hypothetical protein
MIFRGLSEQNKRRVGVVLALSALVVLGAIAVAAGTSYGIEWLAWAGCATGLFGATGNLCLTAICRD